MATRIDTDGAPQDLSAQVAALREQLDKLLENSGATAAGMVREARRATVIEIDTLTTKAREEPVATALFALGGALLGFVLGRLSR